MPSRLERWLLLALAVALLLPVSGAAGQGTQLASRGPRFLLAGWSPSLDQDASRAPVLHRRVSLDLSGVTLDEALKEITRQGGLEISYSPRVVPLDRSVSLHAREITVAAALTELLLDAAVDVSVATGGQLALIQRVRTAAPTAPDTGAVAGRVTDAASGLPLVGATVSGEGTRLSAATNADGRYRIAGLAAGTYTVRARYIGYTPASAAIEIRAGEEATADFSLAKSAQELKQVVVTGTIVPTEVKALPTPVSVIDESDVASQRPHSVMELFRQAVPTAVSWDDASVPYYTAFSVRGASTLGGEIGQMKVLVDGVEVASPSVAAVDPNSIARVEVIRGPQAAAIYGSDAIGGVIQIFTKRGDSTASHPEVEVGAAFGLVQTPYPAFDGVLRQNYTASLRGGGPGVSYNVGGGYGHTADYLPAGELSRQSNPSVYGGIHLVRGIISADVSGRYYTQNNPIVANPGLAETGFFYVAHPFYQPQQRQNQTIGARVGVVATSWWRQVLTLGFDRATQDIAQSQPRRTYAGDTLLTVVDQAQTKAAIGYNSTVSGPMGSGVTGSLTAGFDHYSLPVRSWSTTGALNTSGSIQIASGSPVSAARTLTNNTGYFAQTQLGYRDALFLTAGLRAEQNSSFGDSLGTPVSPRVGLSYARPIGQVTLKLRGSWGEAIRAPSPRDKLAMVSAASITLANPTLGPERQKGWDAGVDAAFGDHASLSLTYYDQTADNLIQFVRLPGTTVPTFQAQNVGRVTNRGVEIEGMASVGPARFKANYGYVRARIEQLAPNYTGDLQVGDQTLITPKHTAGASLVVTPFARTALSAGLTYVGSWNNYNYVAFYSCFGGKGPCQPTSRGYIGAYPGFIKLNAGMSQQITRFASGFVSVDNLTNNQAFEASDLAPVIGRITTVGLQLRY
jgi:outer membrane receptor protein involved in Fe transport